MKFLLGSLVFIYTSMCVFMAFFQEQFIYFPQEASFVEDVEIIKFETEGVVLSGWVVNPTQPKALIYYGGNAEKIEDNISFFAETLPAYTVYLVSYRGYGLSTGKPNEENLYQDALHVFDHVKKKHDDINLMGRSLGTGVATYVGAKRDISKIILITPFDSILNVAEEKFKLLPVSLLLTNRFESSERVQLIKAPVYIFIAENDEVISRARTDSLIEHFNNQYFESIIIKRARHNNIALFPQYTINIKRILN